MNVRTLTMALLMGAAAAPISPWAAAAQSTLERVDQLTRMGRTEEARSTLSTWWEREREGASRRDLQRGLWLRGRLTVDPQQAELDYRRLMVLYPSGEFTADAILKLAQSAWARGDEAAAREFVAVLVRDHPRSRARSAADAWLADSGPLPPSGDTPTPAGGRRPAVAPRPAPDEPDRAQGPAASPPMNYSVQLGAFGEEERALALASEAAAAGVDVRVVRVEGSRFTHVRVGRFAERAGAVELLEALTAQGISAALVRDDRPERPIRD